MVVNLGSSKNKARVPVEVTPTTSRTGYQPVQAPLNALAARSTRNKCGMGKDIFETSSHYNPGIWNMDVCQRNGTWYGT